MEEIGFLGMGIMGKAMAMNLLRNGFKVTVWNRTLFRVNYAYSSFYVCIHILTWDIVSFKFLFLFFFCLFGVLNWNFRIL